MTQDLFSALLAGFFELCGLRSANFNRYLNLFSTPLSSGQQVAIGFGIINVLLVIFWVNRQQIFACLNLWLAIVIPTVLSDLTLNNSLNNVIGDMRSSSWILLGCGGLCYLLAGSVIKRKELSPKLYILTAALATLSVFPGIPGPLIIIFILILFGFRPKETVALVLTAQIPLLFLNTTSFFSSWRESIDTTPTTHLIGFYLATCAGSAAAFYLLNKFIKARRIKAGAHLFSAMACFLLYYTSRHPIPSGNEQLFQYHNPMRIMGTACQIKLIEKDPKIANEMLRVSLVLFNKIENTLSTYKPDSEINAMNISAHEKPFLCSNILWDNFMLAEQAWKMSNGAFDVTIGPLVKLWGIKRKRSQLPTTDEINTARNIVGFHLLT
ncbi:MAG: FAD:protein FMN transferase, partial [Lentisphaeraceae bacterium]|nr:FAD:protein FMN transferase [Lentisphaeraceae bacterium]